MDDIQQHPAYVQLRDAILEHRSWVRKFTRWQIILIAFNSLCLFSVLLSWWAEDGNLWGATLVGITVYAALIYFHLRQFRRCRNRLRHLNNALASLLRSINTFSHTAADHHLDQAAAALANACQ